MAIHERRCEAQAADIPRLIAWVESCCRGDGLSDEITRKFALAIEEAVTNTIDYGFVGLPPPHRIRMRLDIGAESVAAEIIDNGNPYDPTTAPAPDLSAPLAERRLGGLGVHLMRTLMDRLEYRRSDDGHNILRLERARR